MRKLLGTLVLAVGGLIATKGAMASTVLVYDFSLTSFGCFTSDGAQCVGDYTPFQQALDGMKIELLPSALTNGKATLDVNDFPLRNTAYNNTGFAAATLALYPRGPYQVPLIPLADQNASNYIRSLIDLDVGQYLIGSISLLTETSDIQMTTLDSPTPNEWIGVARSDFGSSSFFRYTGFWQFTGVVPEPGTLALLLAALAGVALTTRRRITK